MSSPNRTPTRRRSASLALLAPVVLGGLLATATPASAIPYEGEPTPTSCLRLVQLDRDAVPGSPLFVSFGFALVLSPC